MDDKTKWTILFVFFFKSVVFFGQNAVVSGTVSDALGETLVGASIANINGGSGTVTNAYGFFSLSVPMGKRVRIRASFAGLQTSEYEWILVADTVLQIRLSGGNQLKEVNVIAKTDAANIESIQLGQRGLSMQEIRKIPAMGGETDVLKALSFMPGVSAGAEGSVGLFVRGGTPDQNLILLDGAPVFNVSHLFGFLSVFNPDALKSVDLISGGFPARYGGRLSSILDITMKEGNTERLHGKIGIGLIGSRIALDGPLGKGRKTLFMVSGRTATLKALLVPQKINYNKGNRDAYTAFGFYDMNLKISRSVSHNQKVFFSIYTGDDQYEDYFRSITKKDEFTKLGWGNLTAALRHIWSPSNRVFVRNILTFSKFRYGYESQSFSFKDGALTQTIFNSTSTLKDVTFRSAADWNASPGHYLRGGIEFSRHEYAPQAVSYRFSDSIPSLKSRFAVIPAYEGSVYVEDEWTIGKKIALNTGLRYTYYAVEKNGASQQLQPRVAARWLFNKDLSAKIAFASMMQPIHLLSNNGIGFPNDVWVPATGKVPPQRSWQLSSGVIGNIQRLGTQVSLDLYYKKMSHQIDFQEGANFLFSLQKGWDEVIETDGQGIAYGAEILLRKSAGRFTGLFSYTLARARRQFEKINAGNWYPFKYDRTHELEITENWKINQSWDISLAWIFQTGHTITLPVAKYAGTPYSNSDIFVYTTRNASRLPAYHRADLSLNRTRKKHSGRESVWSLNVFNLYNRRNPYYFALESRYVTNSQGQIISKEEKIVSKSLFPILPSIGWSFSF
jgi:TonB dependent receptor/TonB-dependent Receptor Plug Domain/CarboxypepD_reg-like domain